MIAADSRIGEEVRHITNDDVCQNYDHMREFVAYCKDRQPVHTQKFYRTARHGNDDHLRRWTMTY